MDEGPLDIGLPGFLVRNPIVEVPSRVLSGRKSPVYYLNVDSIPPISAEMGD
jgi:hypothetical protein